MTPGCPPATTFPAFARPWDAQPRLGNDAANWLRAHVAQVAAARAARADVLYLGDSLFARWPRVDPTGWQRREQRDSASILAIGGDTTQNLLWRIHCGALDALAPRTIVLLIGTNDVLNFSAADVARGIGAVIRAIFAVQPHTRILLVALLPRGYRADEPVRMTIGAVNARLRDVVAREVLEHRVVFVDPTPALVESDGSLASAVFTDGLHLTASGYARLAAAIDPPLHRLREGDGEK